jgi:hypothetical protein
VVLLQVGRYVVLPVHQKADSHNQSFIPLSQQKVYPETERLEMAADF